jgi:sugar phosphate isomerase/epimerase
MKRGASMRLGGPVFSDNQGPEEWILKLQEENYRSAVFPLNHDTDDELINQYVNAARRHDILIAEVGAWSNPISKDSQVRAQALENCKKQLELAEKVGAACCVNIAGSRGEQWDGPSPENFSPETFALIVDTIREIIDAVNPKRTFYTLETMPWIFPDSTEAYLQLIKAIDRKAFAVHFDPVNMITGPRIYYNNGAMIKDFVDKLGPYIKSCHAKDITMTGEFMVHLNEVIPGAGLLDYRVLLSEVNRINKDMPIILEHLTTEEEYRQAAGYITNVANELDIPV